MKITRLSASLAVLVAFTATLASTTANADTPIAYEPFSGTDQTDMSSWTGTGSSGFTGNWNRVVGRKYGGSAYSDSVASKVFSKSTFQFPSGTAYTVPGSNTVAGAGNLWALYYSARQLSTGVNFNTNGAYYQSFLLYDSGSSSSHGSVELGLLAGLPTTNTDTTYKSLMVGYSYSSPYGLSIDYQDASQAVWNDSTWSAIASASEPNSGGKSLFILVKITTAASGNDQIQAKRFTVSDTLPTNESAISWDVSYSTPITGTWNYVAVQAEFNTYVDEFRLGATYQSVVGTAIATNLGTPTYAGSLKKGLVTTLTVTSDAPGSVRFYDNGKRIPNCINRPTSGSGGNYSATCNWKPATSNTHQISASITPSDQVYLAANSGYLTVRTSNRTNTR